MVLVPYSTGGLSRWVSSDHYCHSFDSWISRRGAGFEAAIRSWPRVWVSKFWDAAAAVSGRWLQTYWARGISPRRSSHGVLQVAARVHQQDNDHGAGGTKPIWLLGHAILLELRRRGFKVMIDCGGTWYARTSLDVLKEIKDWPHLCMLRHTIWE